jgi:hypothetical protein
MQKPTDPTTFWSKVARGEPNECWEWQGWKDKDGYGRISVKDRGMRTHRYAFLITKGPIGENLQVCHSCDNPACCNPKHLWLGTSAQNTEDSKNKGRKKLFAVKGENHGRAFLSDDDVIRLRMLRGQGWRVTDLANIFCCSKQIVSFATLGVKWKHLPMVPFKRRSVRCDARLPN